MRRFLAWGATLALLAPAEGRPATAAEPAPEAAETRADEPSAPWYRRMFGGPEKPKTPPKPAPRPKPKEVAAKTLQGEMEVYLQRIAVCDRLRTIATETGNADLEKQADEMQQQAWDLYRKKVSHLPGSQLTAADSAEKTLDRRLGTAIESNPLRSAVRKAKSDADARAARAPAKAEENQ